MDHRIRRATYGEQNTERVFQRLVIDNLAWPTFRADKSNGRAPRLLCDAQTVGIDCRYCRGSSRHHAGLRLAIESQAVGWQRFNQIADVWQPSRLKGIQVSQDFGTPFLTATQVFD